MGEGLLRPRKALRWCQNMAPMRTRKSVGCAGRGSFGIGLMRFVGLFLIEAGVLYVAVRVSLHLGVSAAGLGILVAGLVVIAMAAPQLGEPT